jgi:hypothetical protein
VAPAEPRLALARRLAPRSFFFRRAAYDVRHGSCQLAADSLAAQLALQLVDLALQTCWASTDGAGLAGRPGWPGSRRRTASWSQSPRSLWNRDSPMSNSAQASGTVRSPDIVSKNAFQRAFASGEASNPSTCFNPWGFLPTLATRALLRSSVRLDVAEILVRYRLLARRRWLYRVGYRR